MTLEIIFSAANETGFIDNYNAEIWQNIVMGILAFNIPFFIVLFQEFVSNAESKTALEYLRKQIFLRKTRSLDYFVIIVLATILPIFVESPFLHYVNSCLSEQSEKFFWFTTSTLIIAYFIYKSYENLEFTINQVREKSRTSKNNLSSTEISELKKFCVTKNHNELLEFYKNIFSEGNDVINNLSTEFFETLVKHLTEAEKNEDWNFIEKIINSLNTNWDRINNNSIIKYLYLYVLKTHLKHFVKDDDGICFMTYEIQTLLAEIIKSIWGVDPQNNRHLRFISDTDKYSLSKIINQFETVSTNTVMFIFNEISKTLEEENTYFDYLENLDKEFKETEIIVNNPKKFLIAQNKIKKFYKMKS